MDINMKIGVSGQVFAEKYCLKEVLEIISTYGVKNIEIWPGNLSAISEEICNDSFKNRDINDAKELLNHYGVSVSAVSFSGAFVEDIASDHSVYARELCRAVEVAHELGAEYVNHYCFNLSLEKLDIDKIEACMRSGLVLAKEKGITLVLENEAHDATQRPQGMLEILEHFSDDNFKTTFDATNYYQAGGECFPEAYEVLKEHIAYIHIKNGCVYDKRRGHIERFKGQNMTGKLKGNDIYYTPVLEGAVNIEGVINGATLDGYDGFYIAEPHCPVDDIDTFLKKDLNYLLARK